MTSILETFEVIGATLDAYLTKYPHAIAVLLALIGVLLLFMVSPILGLLGLLVFCIAAADAVRL